MSALVVYDTSFGNTEQIARDIASAIPGGAVVRPMSDVDPGRLPATDLLVVGSPTQGGRPAGSNWGGNAREEDDFSQGKNG